MEERISRGRSARTPDFWPTNKDLREVAASAAGEVLPIFQAQLPAMSAGDAAASVYLHPLADVAQFSHILRSAAHAARAKDLECAAEQDAAQEALARATKRATPALLSVLSRYPATSPGTTRVAELVHLLDTALRARRRPKRDQR